MGKLKFGSVNSVVLCKCMHTLFYSRASYINLFISHFKGDTWHHCMVYDKRARRSLLKNDFVQDQLCSDQKSGSKLTYKVVNLDQKKNYKNDPLLVNFGPLLGSAHMQ